MVISKENKKEIEKIQGKKCSICDNYFSYEDLKNKNYEIVTSKITKRNRIIILIALRKEV